MVLDVLIALGIGITQLALTWYGVHVSVQEHRTRNALIIGLIGTVGLVLTVFGTIRSTASLEQIATNTQKRATLKIVPKEGNLALPEPLSENHPLLVNYMFLNTGNEAARKLREFSHVYIEYGNPDVPTTVEHVWQEFSTWMLQTDNLHLAGKEMPFGIPYWATNERPWLVLTSDQIKDIQTGKAYIFLVVSFSFEDEAGSKVQEACFFIQPPADPASPWHSCGRHTAEITVTQSQ
jgi:hypothetical protein